MHGFHGMPPRYFPPPGQGGYFPPGMPPRPPNQYMMYPPPGPHFPQPIRPPQNHQNGPQYERFKGISGDSDTYSDRADREPYFGDDQQDDEDNNFQDQDTSSVPRQNEPHELDTNFYPNQPQPDFPLRAPPREHFQPPNPENRGFGFDPYAPQGYGGPRMHPYPPPQQPPREYFSPYVDQNQNMNGARSPTMQLQPSPEDQRIERERTEREGREQEKSIAELSDLSQRLQSDLEIEQKKCQSLTLELDAYKKHDEKYRTGKQEINEERVAFKAMQDDWEAQRAELEQKLQAAEQNRTRTLQAWHDEKTIWSQEAQRHQASVRELQKELLQSDKKHDETQRQWIKEKGIYRRDNRVLSEALDEQKAKAVALQTYCRSLQANLGQLVGEELGNSPFLHESNGENRLEMMEWQNQQTPEDEVDVQAPSPSPSTLDSQPTHQPANHNQQAQHAEDEEDASVASQTSEPAPDSELPSSTSASTPVNNEQQHGHGHGGRPHRHNRNRNRRRMYYNNNRSKPDQ